MPIRPFDAIAPGSTIDLGEINRALAELRAARNITGTPPLRVDQHGHGTALSFDGDLPFPARLTGEGDPGLYSWVEQLVASDGTLADLEGGRSGTTISQPARELNGVSGLAVGTVVWLHNYSASGYQFECSVNCPAPALPFTFVSDLRCEDGTLNIYKRIYSQTYVNGCLVGALSSEFFANSVACCDDACGSSPDPPEDGFCCGDVTIPDELCLTLSGGTLTADVSVVLTQSVVLGYTSWSGSGSYSCSGGDDYSFKASLLCLGHDSLYLAGMWLLNLVVTRQSDGVEYLLQNVATIGSCSPFSVEGSVSEPYDDQACNCDWAVTANMVNCGGDPGGGDPPELACCAGITLPAELEVYVAPANTTNCSCAEGSSLAIIWDDELEGWIGGLSGEDIIGDLGTCPGVTFAAFLECTGIGVGAWLLTITIDNGVDDTYQVFTTAEITGTCDPLALNFVFGSGSFDSDTCGGINGAITFTVRVPA